MENHCTKACLKSNWPVNKLHVFQELLFQTYMLEQEVSGHKFTLQTPLFLTIDDVSGPPSSARGNP